MELKEFGWVERSFDTFDFAGLRFPLYAHYHNCGHPPGVMTERAIELALANAFLDTVPREMVVEIGAVTPYYWPYRVLNICDPGDPHPRVNMKTNFQNLDLRQKVILSLSTFEHIGQNEVNPELFDNTINQHAFEKLFAESDHFLITVPGGYSSAVDKYLMNLHQSIPNVSVRHIVRIEGNRWLEKAIPAKTELTFRYGALSLLVISRGSFLEHGIPTDAWFNGPGLDEVRSLGWLPCTPVERV